MQKPKERSDLRLKLGSMYYGMRRKLLWIKIDSKFAKIRRDDQLPFIYATHKTPLLRKLKDVDMWMQYNKITNLKLACEKLNGITIRPGEVFSYWKLIGKPTKAKGYLPGMILKSGTFTSGTGGGLCQLSNLIFWMAVHTPLTIVERHRHSYDVFPDSDRTQPFGSGATCAYPYIDLMIQNNTPYTFQLILNVGDEYLEGEWRVSEKPEYRFEIIEKNHEMKAEYWGGYTRKNELYQQVFDLDGNLLSEQLIVKNEALMMYSPFIEYKPE